MLESQKRLTKAGYRLAMRLCLSLLLLSSYASRASSRAPEPGPENIGWDPGHCTSPEGPSLQLNPNVAAFDMTNAYWLSWLSIQAYLKNNAREQLHSVGLVNLDFIDDKSTHFQAFVGSNEQFVVVGFAGTSDVNDVFTDLTFPSKKEFFTQIPGKVHSGFVNTLQKNWPRLFEIIQTHSKKGQPIFVTGHSLGAAHALITAARLTILGIPVETLYLYASPRVGDAEYAQYVSELLDKRIFRFLNNQDMVPRLPPPSAAAEAFSQIFPEKTRPLMQAIVEKLNYTHVGQLLTQDISGALSEPRAFNESEDVSYWNQVTTRSQGQGLPGLVLANWRMIFDHIPFASHCHLKPPQAPAWTGPLYLRNERESP